MVRFRHPINILVLFLTGLMTAASLFAASANYLLDIHTSGNELPDSSVTAIAQTPDGYLWVGTYNGLARFDGVRFVTFDPATTPQLKNARVTGLFVDAWGTLWINTYDGSMTSLRNGVFTNEWRGGQVMSVLSTSNRLFFALAGHHSKMVYRTENSTGHGEWSDLALVGSANGSYFKEDGSGTIWYSLESSIYRLQGTNSEQIPQSSGWRGTLIKCMATDAEGVLWIGTDQGFARWNGHQFEDQTPTNGPSEVNVSSLYCTGEGCWVFGNGKVQKCVDRKWVAEVDATAWRELVDAFRRDLRGYEDRDGGVWFTHLGSGVFHVQPDGRTEHFSAENGLPGNLATCWFQDREGNIWVGLTRGGLVHLRKREFQVVNPGNDLASLAVSTICEDNLNNIWIGTFSGGLYRCRDEKFDRFDLKSGAYKECFFSAFSDATNRIWLSAGREDLHMIDEDEINLAAQAVHGIKAIFVDKEQRVWLGRQNGLSCIVNGSLKNLHFTNGLTNVRALTQDAAGAIWVGTANGDLFRYVGDEFTLFPTGNILGNRAIWALLPQNDGTLWIGTFRGGLLRYKDGSFTRYTTQEGLPNDIIAQLLDDRRGNLWVGSQNGIFSISKNSIRDFDAGKSKLISCTSYGLSDGLPALECSGNYQPACWRDHNGRLWFATAKGPVSVLPREISINHIAPPVVIEEVAVNGKPQPLSQGEDSIAIPPNGRQIDIRFTALSFMAPDKVSFRYKLEGFDDEWVDGGTKRSVQYRALPPKKYRFRVIACNNDGIWNEMGAVIYLIVQPHFWQTWWFEAFVLCSIIGIIFGTIRFAVVRKLHRKLEKLQQQQALQHERERIAKDIHDDMGAGLNRIMLQTALAQRNAEEKTQPHLSRISKTAADLVGAMDEIVWAIDPENDSLDAIVTYAGKFVQEYVTQAGLACRLDLPPQLPDIKISSQERHNLFLAIKEAVNNAIKHARATEISFSLELEPSTFVFIIKDNGAGFVVGAPAVTSESARGRIAGGHGLRNLTARLEKIGGSCAIVSAPGIGTEIRLRVPIQNRNTEIV